MMPAAPTKIEAKLVQALAHLDEKTQKSIDKISLETAKIAEDISYITRDRRTVEEITREIGKFQKEFAPVRAIKPKRLGENINTYNMDTLNQIKNFVTRRIPAER